VTVSGFGGKELKAVTWNASDLKGFPVQIEFMWRGATNRTVFKTVRLLKPDGYQYDPPVGFKRYTTMMGLVQGTMTQGGGRR
jgi:hypothetical protein